MKVTIIGGSGFIGTRIVDHFTQFKGYDFRIVDIRDSHFFNDITTIGDVRNQQQMDSALAGTDLVILLAAQHRDNVTPTSLHQRGRNAHHSARHGAQRRETHPILLIRGCLRHQ